MEVPFSKNLPPENYRQLIKEYALILQDTTLRLKFTRNVLKQFHIKTKRFLFHPAGSERAFRRTLKIEIEKLSPGSGPIIKEAIRNGDISRSRFLSGHAQPPFHPLFFLLLPSLLICISIMLFYHFFNGNIHENPATPSPYPVRAAIEYHLTATPSLKPPIKAPMPAPPDQSPAFAQPIEKPTHSQPLQYPIHEHLSEYPFSFRLIDNQSPFLPHVNTALVGQNNFTAVTGITQTTQAVRGNRKMDQNLFPAENHLETAVPFPEPTAGPAGKMDERESFPEYVEQPIWLVEKSKDAETYSNGLQIITTFAVKNIPRSYVVFPKKDNTLPGKDRLSNRIRGILYHTSEGDMVPLKPEKNRLLKKFSSQLQRYVSRKKGYHYLIDRFGRVYRIVREENAAFHGGKPVWANKDSIFLNLNHAFLGICFEGKGFEEVHEPNSTKTKLRAVDDTVITQAQIQSGKELTDWLRFHYKIPQSNCVPHGIASVYPKDRLVGYHLDLAHGFPFHRFGLHNKYRGMIPSIVEFGFKWDRHFSEALNDKIWPGIIRSEEFLKTKAKQKGLSLKAYRKRLHERFDRYCHWQTLLHDIHIAGPSVNNDPEANEIN